MCVTDRHDMTLAVKVALNPNTTNKLIDGKRLDEPYKVFCLILPDFFVFVFLRAKKTWKDNTTKINVILAKPLIYIFCKDSRLIAVFSYVQCVC